MPKPFTRIDVHYGAPIFVPAELDEAQFAQFQREVGDAIEALEAAHDPKASARVTAARPSAAGEL